MEFDDELLKTIVKEIRLSRSNGGYIEIEKAETRPTKSGKRNFQFITPAELAYPDAAPDQKEEKDPEPVKHDPPVKHAIPRSWIQSVEDEGGYALVHCNANDYILTENYEVFLTRLGWIQDEGDR